MQNPTQNEYIARINKAFDYIESNLGNQFTLQELADIANFSKFHFNRIFYGVVGETPFQFITRVRIERAASLLLSPANESITDIAFKCGFTDISVFSRNFKNFFGVSASQYRKAKTKNSNLSQIDSKNKQLPDKPSTYFCFESKTIKWKANMELNKSVEIKDLPKMTVAYIRHIGPYQGNDKLFEKLWNKLFSWAGPRNLIGGPDFKSLIIYHDDPNVTVEDKLRLSVCITVPPSTKVDGEVGKMELESAKYVIARFVVDATQFGEAWQWLYGQWFPSSGYQPDDKPCFEMYPEEPKDGKFTVDICVPVKPL
jgi:AraC family transcriptional regulator